VCAGTKHIGGCLGRGWQLEHMEISTPVDPGPQGGFPWASSELHASGKVRSTDSRPGPIASGLDDVVANYSRVVCGFYLHWAVEGH